MVTILIGCVMNPVCNSIGSNKRIFTRYRNYRYSLFTNYFGIAIFCSCFTVTQLISEGIKYFVNISLQLSLCYARGNPEVSSFYETRFYFLHFIQKSQFQSQVTNSVITGQRSLLVSSKLFVIRNCCSVR